MNEATKIWVRLFLRLGLVLIAVGVLPIVAVGTILTDWSPLIPVLLSLTVAPLGVLSLLVAAILYLAGRLRQRPGSS